MIDTIILTIAFSIEGKGNYKMSYKHSTHSRIFEADHVFGLYSDLVIGTGYYSHVYWSSKPDEQGQGSCHHPSVYSMGRQFARIHPEPP